MSTKFFKKNFVSVIQNFVRQVVYGKKSSFDCKTLSLSLSLASLIANRKKIRVN